MLLGRQQIDTLLICHRSRVVRLSCNRSQNIRFGSRRWYSWGCQRSWIL